MWVYIGIAVVVFFVALGYAVYSKRKKKYLSDEIYPLW